MPATLLKFALCFVGTVLSTSIAAADTLEVFPMDYIDSGSDGHAIFMRADVIDRQLMILYRCIGRTQRDPAAVSVSCDPLRTQGLEIGSKATIKASGGHREVNTLSYWIVDPETKNVLYCNNADRSYICAKTHLEPANSGG